MSLKSVKAVLMASAIYDILLALIFGLFYRVIYYTFDTALPNHPGYIQLATVYIMIFGIGFWYAAKNPIANMGIIRMGVLMKLGYIVVVFGHWFFGGIPGFYVPFAFIDLVFLILFMMADVAVRRLPATA